MNLDEVPEFLRPRLRLFLSVDLVGSTALKQSGTFPIGKLGDGVQKSDVGARWFSAIAGFYKEIGAKFARHWTEYCGKTSRISRWPTGEPPRLWKSNGDELIYVKELSDAKECVATIFCWMMAAREFREQLRAKKLKLDVKLAAWTAGFPISNSEVIFQSVSQKEVSENDDQLPEYLHYHLLEIWYGCPEKRRDLVRDFIGPSIDTGFRIASRATPRKFMISVEVALIIASINTPRDLDKLPLHYDGRETLKGVLGDRPYPMFWIDTMQNDDLVELEDRVNGKEVPNKIDVRDFCSQFIREHDAYMLYPFITGDGEPQLCIVPDNYESMIHYIAQQWSAVKKTVDIYSKASEDGEANEEVIASEADREIAGINIDIPKAASGSDLEGNTL